MKVPWEEIEQLTQYLEEKGLSEISIETKEGKVTIRKNMQGVITSSVNNNDTEEQVPKQTISPKAGKSNLYEVKSPMVGTFYAASSPGAEPFMQIGSKIKEGTVLCIIEAMKIMNELTSEVSGTVKEIFVSDGETVEYGQVIMRIETELK